MSGQVKFYLDEHVHSAVAAGLRRRDVDVLMTKEAGMLSASDVEHLALASSESQSPARQQPPAGLANPVSIKARGPFNL